MAARLPFLRRRERLTREVRAFFAARGYTEVETPYAVATPGEEVHLGALRLEAEDAYGARRTLWLHTSPEFAMKKLLAAGAGPVVQLARVWRNREGSARHAIEFTMLEGYRPGLGFAELMDEVEALLRAVLPAVVRSAGVATRLDAFERVTVAEAFTRWAGVDVLAAQRAKVGDPLAVLATLTDVLPDDTVLTDFSLRQRVVTISGQSGGAARLIPALAADPALRDPAFTAPVTRNETQHSDGFSIRAAAPAAPSQTRQ